MCYLKNFSVSSYLWDYCIILLFSFVKKYTHHLKHSLDFIFSTKSSHFFFNPYPRICIFVLTERGRNIDQLLSIHALARDWNSSLGLCPDQESSLQSFDAQDKAPTNLDLWPGQVLEPSDWFDTWFQGEKFP